MKKAAIPDPRNLDIQIWVGDGLVHRDKARVSVFDSVVQGGDAVWEGLRVYQGHIGAFDAHLDRLFASARAMAFDQVPDRDWITAAVFATLQANGMTDGVHVRLTLTRGSKTTSGMNPRLNQSANGVNSLASRTIKMFVSLVSETKPRSSSIKAASAPATLACMTARILLIRLLW